MLEPVLRFRDRHSAQIVCDEFGVYMGGPDRDSRYNWMRDILQILEERDIGWSYWNHKNLDFGMMSVDERLFDAAPQYDNPDRLDRELLKIFMARL